MHAENLGHVQVQLSYALLDEDEWTKASSKEGQAAFGLALLLVTRKSTQSHAVLTACGK